MKPRKIVSIVLVTAMLFFAPSMIPRSGAGPGVPSCGLGATGWLPSDMAFAAFASPCPAGGGSHHVAGWFWAVFGCSASIVVSAMVANFRDNRQLTALEASTCGLAFWLARPGSQPKPAHQ